MKFKYLIRFHVRETDFVHQHWDTLIVLANCVSNAEYESKSRINSEFDYTMKDVDVIEIYSTNTYDLLKRIEY